MEPTMEAFYTSVLAYAGLAQSENGDIVNVDPKFGDFTIDSKNIRLPYREYLKNPEGRSFFHLLNESYTTPETAMFSLYKRRMVCELNIRLTELIMKLIRVAADPILQKRIRSTATVELITQLGEVDMDTIESVVTLMKASRKANDEGFLFDIFLKKNGEINDTPYAAIGKINFHAFKEIRSSLETKDSGYKVFGAKMRKKDLLVLETVFQAIFPDISTPEVYYTGTDFKGFRYLNALLKTSYQVSHRVNEVVEQLGEIKEPSLELESAKCDLGWSMRLEELYGMMETIRMIPNQNNPKSDAQHRLNLQEPEVAVATQAPSVRADYQPPHPYQPAAQTPQTAPAQQAYPQPVQQPVYSQAPAPMAPPQPEQLSAEDIVRRGMQQPMQRPGYGYQGQPPGYYPLQQGFPQQPMQPQYQYSQQQMPQQQYSQQMPPGYYPPPQQGYPQTQYPQQMPPGHAPQAMRPMDPFLMARTAAPM